MRQIRLIGLFLGLTLTCGVMAQEAVQPVGENTRPQRKQRITHEQMTEKMVADLKLDAKQTKQVTKLNKKFKTLIEGSQPQFASQRRIRDFLIGSTGENFPKPLELTE